MPPGGRAAIHLTYCTGTFILDDKAETVIKGVSGSRYALSRKGKMTGISLGVATFEQRSLTPYTSKGGAYDLLLE